MDWYGRLKRRLYIVSILIFLEEKVNFQCQIHEAAEKSNATAVLYRIFRSENSVQYNNRRTIIGL